MLKKIISIKNVGRFKNSAASPNPQLGNYVFIYGANGFGKTTICSVLRSLQMGDAAILLGRKTLGVTGIPTVEFLLDTGPVSFDGSHWSATVPNIVIFDGTFIAQNVYSGETVEIDHKRNLYRVIIGQEGVALAEEEARLASESRTKTGEISAAEKAIRPHLPSGMTMAQFLTLPQDLDIDSKIEAQEKRVAAALQASDVKAHARLSALHVPHTPGSLSGLLLRTLDDIADDTEGRVNEHLKTHHMAATGERWISEGMEYLKTDSCPFCGQGTGGLALISAFRAFFGEAYRNLKADIAAVNEKTGQEFGDGAIGKLTTQIAQNRATAEFWEHYVTFDYTRLVVPELLVDAMRRLGREAEGLLRQKASSPLESIPLSEAFNGASEAYLTLHGQVQVMNEAIAEVNSLIDAKKTETAAADLKSTQSALDRLRAIKKRHTADVAQICSEHIQAVADKAEIEADKDSIRKQLEDHTKTVVQPYERRINRYLDSFNAGFRLAETKHAYPGGVATSSYQLVINSVAIDVGDAKTPSDQPSFKNTLSAGDRTTLALAFFLAHLERDTGKAEKIAVFDDPFASQDAFRRRQTVHEIKRVGSECAQVVVLSHDVTFLKQVWEKAPAADRVALQIYDARSQGSKLLGMDIDRACQGRVASEIDDLITYETTGAGKPLDLIKKMRVVLETHCRTTYPAYFQANDWLGDIVRKIREGDDEHPAKSLYDEVDQINDYTASYHHGEDVADATPEDIDPEELTGFVRRTLKIVNALQA